MSLTSGRRLPGCPWTTASGRGPAFGVSFLWVHAAKGANSEARTWPAGILLHFPPLMSQCWRDPAEPSAGFKPQGDTEVDLGGPEAAHTHPLHPHSFPGTQQRGREAWPPPSAAHKIGRQRQALGLWQIPCFLQINQESNTEQWLALL